MKNECGDRSTTGNPARKTALNNVVLTWQIPPPTPGVSTPFMMTGATSKPEALVRGPTVPLNEKVWPGRTTAPSSRAATCWMLCARATLALLKKVVNEAISRVERRSSASLVESRGCDTTVGTATYRGPRLDAHSGQGREQAVPVDRGPFSAWDHRVALAGRAGQHLGILGRHDDGRKQPAEQIVGRRRVVRQRTSEWDPRRVDSRDRHQLLRGQVEPTSLVGELNGRRERLPRRHQRCFGLSGRHLGRHNPQRHLDVGCTGLQSGEHPRTQCGFVEGDAVGARHGHRPRSAEHQAGVDGQPLECQRQLVDGLTPRPIIHREAARDALAREPEA